MIQNMCNGRRGEKGKFTNDRKKGVSKRALRSDGI